MALRFILLLLTTLLLATGCWETDPKGKEGVTVNTHPDTQLEIDVQAVRKYLKNNDIQATETESGLFYKLEFSAKESAITEGSKVKFHVVGEFLNGTQFYSSYEAGQPLEVIIGQKMVIPGMEEGLQLLNEGEKATFYIPSPLAYGSEGSGTQVPPNAILIQHVEVISVD